jgi:hypothetical protein
VAMFMEDKRTKATKAIEGKNKKYCPNGKKI